MSSKSDQSFMKRKTRFFPAKLLFLLMLLIGVLPASSVIAKPLELSQLSIEELMSLEIIPVITSVSRRAEKVSETPAAVFVISAEDIRRSGVTSIPEALRMAPGLNVAQIDGSKWAISARGMNDRFSRNLLVLIDGRSVYSPLFAGVWWDVQDTLLEDIERIEVVRGPGGTTWGANAVNGIVNIVTKSATDTKGALISTGKGNFESDFSYRYGQNLGDNGAFRFYVKALKNEPLYSRDGRRGIDDYNQTRFGLRADWEASHSRKMTLDAGLYSGNSHEEILKAFTHASLSAKASETKVSGGHVRFMYLQSFRSDNELKLQFYFDRTRRVDGNHEESFDTLDLDLQHSFFPWKSHEFVWGIGYRSIKYSLPPGKAYSFSPSQDTQGIQSFFFQDQITLKPQTLFWTFGTKIYHHPYVGTEGQPSTKLFWKPLEKHHFWSALTETRRVPSIEERSTNGKTLNVKTGAKEVSQIQESANSTQKSEIMKAKEIGYRFIPNKMVSFDLALFKQDYSQLAYYTSPTPHDEKAAPASGTPPMQAQVNTNGELSLTGAELSFQWKPRKEFRLVGGISFNKQHSTSYTVFAFSPNQWFMRTYWDISKNMQLDLSYNDDSYEADSSEYLNSAKRNFRNNLLNARIGWRPNASCEISLSGQNLLSSKHREFPVDSGPAIGDYVPSLIPRSLYLKATWFFE